MIIYSELLRSIRRPTMINDKYDMNDDMERWFTRVEFVIDSFKEI